MKNRILLQVKITVCWVLFLAIFWTGCTKKSFEDRNIDPTRLTSLSPSDVKSLFPSAEYAGMNTGPGSVDYQQAQNLFADMFCQYFAGTQTAFSSLRYVIQQSWVTYQWRSTYLYAMPALVNIIKETKTPETITLNAIARIWKVFVLHRTTDYFGPIPYSNIGVASTSIPYDSQQSIYMDFFKELNEAANDLKNNLNVPSYGVQDVIFNGDNAKWLKFANTLRLRLALRISDVEPAMAQQEADSALANGIMTDFSDDAYLAVSAPNDYNGLSRIASWNEFRMSANMQSLLVGYNDPRLSKFFQPAVNTGLYTGLRQGMVPAEQTLPQNDYNNASNLSVPFTSDDMFITPMPVMHSAEAYFLRAQGALKGWDMGGTAEELYNEGIEMSLRTWGITDNSVINNYINGTSLPMAPGGYFNTPALTNIPVKFSSDPALELEQVLTQKYLALYPDGFEAWAEMRQTGFPKFYPLIHSDNPDVPADSMIRRIPFLTFDRQLNGPAVDSAVSLLKGPDNAATRLWWDVK